MIQKKRRERHIYRCLLLLLTLIGAVVTAVGNRQSTVGATALEATDLVAEIPLRVQTTEYQMDAQGIRVPGYALNNVAGSPALPVWSRVVTLPPTGSWEVSYTSEGAQELKAPTSLPAVPVPDQQAISAELTHSLPDAIPLLDQPDPAIYGADALYPPQPVTAGKEQWQRGQRLLVVRAFPFQYNPVTGRLLYHPDLRITIRVQSGTEAHALKPAGGTAAFAGSVEGALRIYTGERGIYRLSYGELQAAGVAVGTLDPATFAVSYLGQPVDIQRIGDGDSTFESGEAVLFYAEPYEGRYLTRNVYWFTYGGTPSALIRARSAPRQGTVVEQITQTLHIEVNQRYMSRFPRPETGDRWFGAPLSVNNSQPPTSTLATQKYNLTLDDPTLVGTIELHAVVHGTHNLAPRPDHSIALRLNSHEVGQYQWDGVREKVISATLPATWLDGTPNRLTLEANLAHFPPDSLFSYTVYPDYFEITYPALADAEGESIYIEEMV
nr:hypothetical protein [Ardenticatenales bacterium]